MKRRPRKIITRVIVFLLLGAIVNVAVAWGAFVSAQTDEVLNSAPATGSAEETTLWNRHRSPGWPISPGTSGTRIRPLVEVQRLQFIAIGLDRTDHFRVKRVRCGFPLRCFSWEEWRGAPADRRVAPTSGDDGLHISNLTLPKHVLWIGLTINTALYAVLLWLPFSAPLAARRRWRIKRRLCPACAYPVGTSEVCTECGKPVRAAWAPSAAG